MAARADYTPGPAAGAKIEKSGDVWTLVMQRELPHAPAMVWAALTEPDQLRAWAPYDADRALDRAGPVRLTTVGAPSPLVSDSVVKRADAPRLLEFTWGGQDIRWQLEPVGSGATRLTLWHHIDRRYIAMGAAGWHLCLDVLARQLGGRPIGRIVGADAFRLEGWQQLHAGYQKYLGVETPRG